MGVQCQTEHAGSPGETEDGAAKAAAGWVWWLWWTWVCPRAFAIIPILMTRLHKELWSLTWTLSPCWGHVPGSAVPVTFSRQGFDTGATELTDCCPLALSTLHWTWTLCRYLCFTLSLITTLFPKPWTTKWMYWEGSCFNSVRSQKWHYFSLNWCYCIELMYWV